MTAPHIATQDMGLLDLATPRHTHEVLERGLRVMRGMRWPSEALSLPALDELRFRFGDHDGEQVAWYLRETGGVVSAVVRLFGGELSGFVAANTDADIDRFITDVAAACPRTVIDDDRPRVPVTFWSLSQHGPRSRTRTLDVHPWDDVDDNYPVEVRRDLGRLVAPSFEPGAGGQLLVWHGPPGTGKTSALRSLAWEWRSWCSVHYVTDPETFFGARADYMLEVLLSEDDGDTGVLAAPVAGRADEKPPADPEPPTPNRWRLVVLEDAGEMLAKDAKERAGQGLSRLLNVADGLIGQGLRVLVLITTNEPLKSLSDAVSRPGRCASEIEFGLFDSTQARLWLVDHDADLHDAAPLASRMSLADLYARLAGQADDREPATVGFVR